MRFSKFGLILRKGAGRYSFFVVVFFPFFEYASNWACCFRELQNFEQNIETFFFELTSSFIIILCFLHFIKQFVEAQ